MSGLTIDDEEMIELRKQGAKFRMKGAPEKAAPKKSDVTLIIEAINRLGLAIENREEPEINVRSPEVKVSPVIKLPENKPAHQPRKWVVHIERDNTADQRIKSLTFDAID